MHKGGHGVCRAEHACGLLPQHVPGVVADEGVAAFAIRWLLELEDESGNACGECLDEIQLPALLFGNLYTGNVQEGEYNAAGVSRTVLERKNPPEQPVAFCIPYFFFSEIA